MTEFEIRRRLAKRIPMLLGNEDAQVLLDEIDRLRGRVAQAWDSGFASGKSRAMRHMSDEPDLPLDVPNPFRQGPTYDVSPGAFVEVSEP